MTAINLNWDTFNVLVKKPSKLQFPAHKAEDCIDGYCTYNPSSYSKEIFILVFYLMITYSVWSKVVVLVKSKSARGSAAGHVYF